MTERSRVKAISRSCRDVAVLALATWLLAGCTALPNTSGYTAATIQLKQAVATAGGVVETEVALTPGTDSSLQAEKFRWAWKETVKSLDAMVAYAQSIEQIVDAGNKGAESAQKVADSVKKLSDSIGVDLTTAAAAKVFDVSAQTGAFVVGEAIKAVAAKDLETSLDRAGPWAAIFSEAVQAQIVRAESLFVLKIADQTQGLEVEYIKWTSQRPDLEKQELNATTALLKLTAQDPSSISDEKIKQLETNTGQIELARKLLAPHLEEYETKLAQIRQREKAGLSILSASENCVAAWSIAHQELVKAVKERKPVSVESLVAAVVEARTLIERWREL